MKSSWEYPDSLIEGTNSWIERPNSLIERETRLVAVENPSEVPNSLIERANSLIDWVKSSIEPQNSLIEKPNSLIECKKWLIARENPSIAWKLQFEKYIQGVKRSSLISNPVHDILKTTKKRSLFTVIALYKSQFFLIGKLVTDTSIKPAKIDKIMGSVPTE
ncbi:MAG: hypothetical protein ACQEUT_01545 [Bacillota bacterium]